MVFQKRTGQLKIKIAIVFFSVFFANFAAYTAKNVYYRVTLVTPDDWKLSAKFLPPEKDNPVIIFLHSLGNDKSDWNLLINKITGLGYGYLTFDFRGHGESIYKIGEEEPISYEKFERVGINNEFNRMVSDVYSAIKYLKYKKIEEDRIILAGAGIGANIAHR
jgi:pimeloyl-ACP methyl ester carboxylesterase